MYCCPTMTIFNLRVFSSLQKETSCPLVVTPSPTSPWKPLICLSYFVPFYYCIAFHCIDIPLLFNYASICCFYLLAIMSNAANSCVQVFVWHSFSHLLGGVAGSYCDFMFNLLRGCPTITVFQSGCPILPSHPAVHEGSIFCRSLPVLDIVLCLL